MDRLHEQRFQAYFRRTGLYDPNYSHPTPGTINFSTAARAVEAINRPENITVGSPTLITFLIPVLGRIKSPNPLTESIPRDALPSITRFRSDHPGAGKTMIINFIKKTFEDVNRVGSATPDEGGYEFYEIYYEDALTETKQRPLARKDRDYQMVMDHLAKTIASAVPKERGIIVEDVGIDGVDQQFGFTQKLHNRTGEFDGLKFHLNDAYIIPGPDLTYLVPIGRELMKHTRGPEDGLPVAKALGWVPLDREKLTDEEWYEMFTDGASIDGVLKALDEEDAVLIEAFVGQKQRLEISPFKERPGNQFDDEVQFRQEVLYPKAIPGTSGEALEERRLRRPLAMAQLCQTRALKEDWENTSDNLLIGLNNPSIKRIGINPDLVNQVKINIFSSLLRGEASDQAKAIMLRRKLDDWDYRWDRTLA